MINQNRTRIVATVIVVIGAATAVPARAQHLPLANVLPDLILREITLQSPPTPAGAIPGLPDGFTHLAHFSPIEAGDLDNPVVGIVESFNSQMATQFSTFPLGSSTGGLTYVFDETVGTFRRGSGSFGPAFAERALTIGRRRLSIGFNYQRTSYDTFEGQDLGNGSIKFYLRHQDCCTVVQTPASPSGFILTNEPNGTRLNTPFEGDLIEATLFLKAVTHTTAIFANYGVTSRWDVGLAVPIVSVDLDARVLARILRLVTGPPPDAPISPEQRQSALNVHTFELNNPDATLTVQHAGHATGLGDVVVRTKYHFLRAAGGGLAAAIDLRLPTGDEAELLGTGGTQGKILIVASSELRRVAQHVNVGYTFARGHVAGAFAGLASQPLPDEINYSGGLELIAHPRLTVVGDIVGRTLRSAGRLDLVSKQFEYAIPTPGATCAGLAGVGCTSTSLDEFAPRAGNLNVLLGSAGAKFNVRGNLLVTANVLFPLTSAGLHPRITTVVGLDYAF